MGFEKFPQKRSSTDESDPKKVTRRDFLRSAGAAIAVGLASDLSEAASKTEQREGIPTVEESEDIPIEAGIHRTFEILLGENASEERRKLTDDMGVYLWEVKFQIEGGTAEFGYMRKGSYDVGGSASKTKIYIYFCDQEGEPAGGHDVAEYVDGDWSITDLRSLE